MRSKSGRAEERGKSRGRRAGHEPAAGWVGKRVTDLRLRGLTKSFGRVSALRGVTLDIEAGEFFAILGPSASGKTTTLRCIAGIESPDDGQVIFDGRDVTAEPVQSRAMAMVFQTFALYPHMSIYDNLAYPLREARLDRAQVARRVGEVAEMLRLTHTLKRKPSTASGGEQQRVAIGRALIRKPRLLLLDEPLTNLDAKLRHDTRAEFKRLHREIGGTMLYVTPDQLEALSMGQRVGVLKDGRIVQVGTPAELYRAPDDDYVATMIGDPPMNMLQAKLKSGGDAPVVALPFAEVSGGPWSRSLSAFSSGQELWFGIRPHDLKPVAGDPHGPNFKAKVHLTEPLGDVTVLDMQAAETVFKIVLPEEEALAYPVGAEIQLQFDVRYTHVFAQQTGTAIR
jgi:multiple sugar transport system ATP-binding protein